MGGWCSGINVKFAYISPIVVCIPFVVANLLPAQMSMELMLTDTQVVADLTLELAFVLTTKTLLSEERHSTELPLRFDIIFEEYMKLAVLLLDTPPLDFTRSSYSLREFAKLMEKNGFISLDVGLM